MARYETIVEIEKRYEEIQEVRKFNHNHDSRGRFSSSKGGGGVAGGKMASANGGYFDETDTKKFTDAVAKAQSKIAPEDAWRVSAPSQE